MTLAVQPLPRTPLRHCGTHDAGTRGVQRATSTTNGARDSAAAAATTHLGQTLRVEHRRLGPAAQAREDLGLERLRIGCRIGPDVRLPCLVVADRREAVYARRRGAGCAPALVRPATSLGGGGAVAVSGLGQTSQRVCCEDATGLDGAKPPPPAYLTTRPFPPILLESDLSLFVQLQSLHHESQKTRPYTHAALKSLCIAVARCVAAICCRAVASCRAAPAAALPLAAAQRFIVAGGARANV